MLLKLTEIAGGIPTRGSSKNLVASASAKRLLCIPEIFKPHNISAQIFINQNSKFLKKVFKYQSSYYLVGVPSGFLLAFHFHVGGRGLWLGIICALVVQVFGLALVTIFTNWDKEAKKATHRVDSSSSLKDFAVHDRSTVVF